MMGVDPPTSADHYHDYCYGGVGDGGVQASQMALVTCAFVHVKYHDTAAVHESNALLDHFTAPLHAYLSMRAAAAAAAAAAGSAHDFPSADLGTLLMALAVWRECVARGAATGRWQPGGYEAERVEAG